MTTAREVVSKFGEIFFHENKTYIFGISDILK
jgi:hypothetical protein